MLVGVINIDIAGRHARLRDRNIAHGYVAGFRMSYSAIVQNEIFFGIVFRMGFQDGFSGWGFQDGFC